MNNDIWTPERDPWDTYPPFELEVVRRGVAKGKRHFSFKQYLGWLIKNDYSKDEAKETIFAWNQLNHPPIPESELKYLFEFYWAMWCKLPEEE